MHSTYHAALALELSAEQPILDEEGDVSGVMWAFE
jgi:hypothetical protein